MSDMAGAEGAAPQGGEPQAPDLSPVMDRVNELSQQFQDFTSNFQPGQDPGYDPYQAADPYGAQEPGFQYGQPDPQYQPQDPYGVQQQQVPQQQAVNELQNLISQAVGQATAPLTRRLDAQELQRHNQGIQTQREALMNEFPELSGEAGQQITQAAQQQALEIARMIAPVLDPGAPQQEHQLWAQELGKLIADQPGFLKNAYLASKASSIAGQETPASASQGNELEPAGGAAQQAGEQSPGATWLGQTGQRPERSLSELF